jgi:branched-chain amino acid transport system substrate-binding protein
VKKTATHLLVYPLYLSILIGLVIDGAGCENKKPIRIGFVGGLTGRLSDLGIAGRNGVTLAIEACNAAGGIKGRPVELLTKDDKQDAQAAVAADKELIDKGVVAIIGHMTSSMSLAALPVINQNEILMISPTTSTNQLMGIDDYFFRVTPPNKIEIDHLAGHAFKALGLKKMAAVYDLSNQAYTEGYLQDFTADFEARGGSIVTALSFRSGSGTHFADLAQALLAEKPEGVLIIAGALDAAMICQHIRLAGSKVPIISCGWAMTNDLIANGGPAIEGVIFSHPWEWESQRREYLDFKERFRSRFGSEPNFAAAKSYEAAQIILEALAINDDPKKLKATILKQKVFHGIHGDFTMDPYGDPKRDLYLIVVRDGTFRTLN